MARRVFSEKMGGAKSLCCSFTQSFFLQLSRLVLSLLGGMFKFEAVRKIRDFAMSEDSIELEQLASRVASAMHAEVSNGDDFFCRGERD